MISIRKIAALAALMVLAAPIAGFAQNAGYTAPGIQMTPSRFSGPGVYTGQPALAVTLSMVIAGGGPSNFDATTLLKTLTGDKFDAEVASLTKQYGKDKVGNFITVFNYVITDSLQIVKAKKIQLPSTPNPDPKNGEALAGALWAAGQTGSTFNVEVMLDRAVSHPIHVQVMDDIDKKFGVAKDADYHAVLNTAMHDLATVYKLNAQGQMKSSM